MNPFASFRKWFEPYRPPMAVQVDYQGLRCLWVEAGPQPPVQARHAAAAPLPDGVLQVHPGRIEILDGTAISRCVESILPPPPHPRRVLLMVPDAAVMFLLLKIEDWPRRAAMQRELVRWHLQQQLNTSLDSYRTAWQALPGAKSRNGRRIAVLAAWKPFLDHLDGILAEHGLNPGLTLPVSLFLDNFLFRHPELRTRRLLTSRVLLVHWDRERMTATFFDGGELLLKRSRTLTALAEGGTFEDVLPGEIRILLVYLQDYYQGKTPDLLILSGERAAKIAARIQDHAPARALADLLAPTDWPRGLEYDESWMPLATALNPCGGLS